MKVLFGRSLCSIAHKPRQTPKFWRVFSRLSQTNHTHKSLVLMFFLSVGGCFQYGEKRIRCFLKT